MSELPIRHGQDTSKGSWYIERDGARVAEMTYSKAGESRIIIDHTEVDPSLKGQGVGKALVESAVEWARVSGVKILPLCPFAKAMIARHPEWQDVLD
jgi:hypothetical protein